MSRAIGPCLWLAGLLAGLGCNQGTWQEVRLLNGLYSGDGQLIFVMDQRHEASLDVEWGPNVRNREHRWSVLRRDGTLLGRSDWLDGSGGLYRIGNDGTVVTQGSNEHVIRVWRPGGHELAIPVSEGERLANLTWDGGYLITRYVIDRRAVRLAYLSTDTGQRVEGELYFEWGYDEGAFYAEITPQGAYYVWHAATGRAWLFHSDGSVVEAVEPSELCQWREISDADLNTLEGRGLDLSEVGIAVSKDGTEATLLWREEDGLGLEIRPTVPASEEELRERRNPYFEQNFGEIESTMDPGCWDTLVPR